MTPAVFKQVLTERLPDKELVFLFTPEYHVATCGVLTLRYARRRNQWEMYLMNRGTNLDDVLQACYKSGML